LRVLGKWRFSIVLREGGQAQMMAVYVSIMLFRSG
jgi:hypothetical protein